MPAKNILKAMAYCKDEVYTSYIFLRTMKDVFAADIIYYENRLNNYLVQFGQDVDTLDEIW